MRRTTSRSPAASRGPDPAFSPAKTLAGTVIVLSVVVAALVALTYPVAAAATVGLALATAPVGRLLVRYRRTRRETERTRKVCVPSTGVCVDV